MKEPLPIISAPGAIIAAYLLVFILLHLSISAISLAIFSVLTVIISPLFFTLFHSTWLCLTKGYQGFGYQSKLTNRYSANTNTISRAYDKALYANSCDQNTIAIDYLRRRSDGYLLNLQLETATVMSLVIYSVSLSVINKPLYKYEIVTLVLVSAIAIFLFEKSRTIINSELSSFEEDIFGKKINEEVAKTHN